MARSGVLSIVNALVLSMDDLEVLPATMAMSTPRSHEIVGAIYDDHQRELYSFALHACRDRDAAEDLVQEAFVRLMIEVDAGRMPTNVRAWLYRVVANLAVSRGRRATVARRGLHAVAEHEEDQGPEPTYLDGERRSDLETVLGELAADARTALLMAASGFSGLEIAEAIGRSPNATRTLMCRARIQLRERLISMEASA
jgi:RNA polymerase sigma-70 factor (ECF subfamily)